MLSQGRCDEHPRASRATREDVQCLFPVIYPAKKCAFASSLSSAYRTLRADEAVRRTSGEREAGNRETWDDTAQLYLGSYTLIDVTAIDRKPSITL